MNKKVVAIQVAKVVVTAGALAAALAGCCMFGSDKGSCGKPTCGACCEKPACGTQAECCDKKTSGVNASMSVGMGTDGVQVGSAANVGSHGVSGNVGGGVH